MVSTKKSPSFSSFYLILDYSAKDPKGSSFLNRLDSLRLLFSFFQLLLSLTCLVHILTNFLSFSLPFSDNTTRFFLISNSEKAHQLTSKPSTSNSNSKLRALFLLERTSISISSHNSSNDSASGRNLNLLDLVLSIIYKDSESGLRVRKLDRLNKNLLKSSPLDGSGTQTTNGIKLEGSDSRNGFGNRNGNQNKSGTDQDEEDPESTWVNPYLIELEMDSNQSRNLREFRERIGKIKEEFESKVSKEMEIGKSDENGKVNEDQRFTSLLRCLGCWVF